MFDALTGKLDAVFKKLRGRGVLKEEDVKEAMREVRLALLEADVNFKVVKEFVNKVQERAVGREILASLTPGQQVIKVVHEELVSLLGGTQSKLHLSSNPPTVIMMVGLQGSGKTTTAGKLARNFKKDGRKVLLVPADTRRPAAIEQLKTLARQVGVDAFTSESMDPVAICRAARDFAERSLFEVVILDTAGRLQIDAPLMDELRQIKTGVKPHEVLFVADAMTGQEAVNIAETFNKDLGFDGVVLTKLDGDARGGAALSVKAVTGRPIKFTGMGEKLDALEPFFPDRMASRILGMGDVMSLIEKAQETVNAEEAAKLAKKLKQSSFDLEDFRGQLKQVKKMGGLGSIMGMIPGMSKMKLPDADVNDKELVKVDAIISSMTPRERANHTIINGSRRARIAKGSGTQVQDVNRLLKQFAEMQKMMKMMKGGKMKDMGRMFGGRLPR
ncbi:MAG: signal recognition particle protein [Nitrospirae bacterium]|nr:signal recognition particle protein [Nitrospirota bacterium]NTW66113.1 signal recognition particle protein [Nitrospirota bacterium]